MYTHCYRNKTSDQFIDFIRRIDSKYDSGIKTIFVVLDNASIHRSIKTRNAILRIPISLLLVIKVEHDNVIPAYAADELHRSRPWGLYWLDRVL